MSYPDLQSFLHFLEREGELRRIKVEVDPELEITEIVTRVVRESGPALLFERVKGSPFPLAINIFGSERRIEMALGRHPQQIGEDLVKLIECLNPPSLKSLWRSCGLLRRLLSFRLKNVRHPPCQEVIESPPNIFLLPALKCWPKDGGRFLTLPLVYTKDPKGGQGNLGIYRMQVFSKDRAGMHWQIQKGGGFHYFNAEKLAIPLEVAVVLGGDPALILSAALPLPEGVDEVLFSGILRGKPTPATKAKSLSLMVPANAEFILEGKVYPGEKEMEGPFGDHFGHYSKPSPFPVFHVQMITRRRNPIYPAVVVGKPPQEDLYIGNAVQEMLKPLIKMMHPGIRDMWAYPETGFHNLLVVSVERRYKMEPIKIALGLLGEGQLALTKCIILVDPDVNVKDIYTVLQAIRSNFDAENDFLMIPHAPQDTLDFTGTQMNVGGKMIIDATSSTSSSPPNPPHLNPQKLCPEILEWRVLEDVALVVKVKERGRGVIERLLKSPQILGVKILAAVSPNINLQDQTELLWGIFTHFNPASDVLFSEIEFRGIAPVYRGVMGIDATIKPGYPEILEMDPQIKEKVSRRWEEYWR